ncbi:hypothetical protein QEN19_000288 [Hanseniaspora menglaensis]
MSTSEQTDKLSKILKALSNEDVGFYAATDKSVKKAVSAVKKRLLGNLNKLVINIDKNNNTVECCDDENVFDHLNSITDILDAAFEKSDKIYDSLKRASIKRKRGDLDDDNIDENYQYLEENLISREPQTKKQRTVKPQLDFKVPIDNTDASPFTPKVKSKPFAIEPLSKSLKLIESTENIPQHYGNPYEYEIMNQPYHASVFAKTEPVMSKEWTTTSAIYVEEKTTLLEMLNDLKKQNEIAVDLEHHDLRTYYGLTCLMQISTREADYIIDTLALREELSVLNEVFCDPSVTKVFHGAFMDIIWLQRDLGIYVVSLFDTYHASRALGFAKHSLAFLLENFAKFKTSKQYQLADWRQRPLTSPLLSYARSDTHFLLNIFDKLRNMLIDSKKIDNVLSESRNVAVRRFENNKFRPTRLTSEVYSVQEKSDPWVSLARNYNIPLYLEPLMKALFFWRDGIAREEDESPRYIMSNQFLANLVIARPVDATSVLSTNGQMTVYISKNSHMLAQLVKNEIKKINKSDAIIQSNEVNKNLADISVDNITAHTVVSLKHSFHEIITSLAISEEIFFQKADCELKNYVFSLSKDKWNSGSKFISYQDKDLITLAGSEELADREKIVNQEFSLPIELGDTYLASLIDTKTEDEEPISKMSTENNVKIVLKNDEKIPDVNVESVIVLNQKGVDQRQKAYEEKLALKENQIMNADIIPLDYESGSKVLINPDFRKSKKKNKKATFNKSKKESFNPYEESGNNNNTKNLAPPRKSYNKKKSGGGKSITFKKK